MPHRAWSLRIVVVRDLRAEPFPHSAHLIFRLWLIRDSFHSVAYKTQTSQRERDTMSQKLGIGATFPDLGLKLVTGETLNVPTDLSGNYKVILFYRGHW